MAYHHLQEQIEDNSRLAFLLSREQQVDRVVQDCAEKLVECVLLGEKSWIFLTHFDVFLQDDPSSMTAHGQWQESTKDCPKLI